MKHLCFILMMVMSAVSASAMIDIPYTEYNYKAHYRLGPVDVSIGEGMVTVKKEGAGFHGTLDGNSIPWHGRIFCVSDTLRASLDPESGTIEYINGWYMKPEVDDYDDGLIEASDLASYKNINGGGDLDASYDTMEAIDIMSNMTALYYYFKVLDFPKMLCGEKVVIPMYRHGNNEKVVITYHGESTLKIDDSEYATYFVTFEYSYKGSMSGYTVKSHIDKDTRVPLQFSSSLPIGHVEMTLKE